MTVRDNNAINNGMVKGQVLGTGRIRVAMEAFRYYHKSSMPFQRKPFENNGYLTISSDSLQSLLAERGILVLVLPANDGKVFPESTAASWNINATKYAGSFYWATGSLELKYKETLPYMQCTLHKNTISFTLLNKCIALVQFLLASRRSYLYLMYSLTKYFKILNFEETTERKIIHFSIHSLT